MAYIRVLDIKKLNDAIREAFFRTPHAQVCKDPELKYDTITDHNKIIYQIFLVYTLRTIKLVFTILQFSYYTGLLWFIYCDVTMDLMDIHPYHQPFITKFGLASEDPKDLSIKMCYWAFTTLCTVGFGDLYPSNEVE